MSQRECAGFNWPPLAIPAEQPVSISPETVKRAGVASRACIAALRNPPFAARRSAAGSVQSVLSPSAASGVLQPASRAISFSGRALCVYSFPGFSAPLWPLAAGVGQPATIHATTDGRSSSRPLRAISARQPSSVLAPLSPSAALGVGHPP